MKCKGDMPTTEAVVRCNVRSLIPRSRAASEIRNGSDSRSRTQRSNSAIVGSARASNAGMANAACEGRSPMSRYRAVRSAKLGLCCCTIDRARSMWAKAAPAVVIRASLRNGPSLVQQYRRIMAAKRGTEPPAGRCQPSVEHTGFGQEEGSRARAGQLRAVGVTVPNEVEGPVSPYGVDDRLRGLHSQRRHDQQFRKSPHLLDRDGVTMKPLPVRTCFFNPTIVTVNGVGDAGTSCRSAFAVARMSTTAESPESKQPSTARTATSTSEMILNVAGPPLPISRLDTYGGDILGGSRR